MNRPGSWKKPDAKVVQSNPSRMNNLTECNGLASSNSKEAQTETIPEWKKQLLEKNSTKEEKLDQSLPAWKRALLAKKREEDVEKETQPQKEETTTAGLQEDHHGDKLMPWQKERLAVRKRQSTTDSISELKVDGSEHSENDIKRNDKQNNETPLGPDGRPLMPWQKERLRKRQNNSNSFHELKVDESEHSLNETKICQHDDSEILGPDGRPLMPWQKERMVRKCHSSAADSVNERKADGSEHSENDLKHSEKQNMECLGPDGRPLMPWQKERMMRKCQNNSESFIHESKVDDSERSINESKHSDKDDIEILGPDGRPLMPWQKERLVRKRQNNSDSFQELKVDGSEHSENGLKQPNEEKDDIEILGPDGRPLMPWQKERLVRKHHCSADSTSALKVDGSEQSKNGVTQHNKEKVDIETRGPDGRPLMPWQKERLVRKRQCSAESVTDMKVDGSEDSENDMTHSKKQDIETLGPDGRPLMPWQKERLRKRRSRADAVNDNGIVSSRSEKEDKESSNPNDKTQHPQQGPQNPTTQSEANMESSCLTNKACLTNNADGAHKHCTIEGLEYGQGKKLNDLSVVPWKKQVMRKRAGPPSTTWSTRSVDGAYGAGQQDNVQPEFLRKFHSMSFNKQTETVLEGGCGRHSARESESLMTSDVREIPNTPLEETCECKPFSNRNVTDEEKTTLKDSIQACVQSWRLVDTLKTESETKSQVCLGTITASSSRKNANGSTCRNLPPQQGLESKLSTSSSPKSNEASILDSGKSLKELSLQPQGNSNESIADCSSNDDVPTTSRARSENSSSSTTSENESSVVAMTDFCNNPKSSCMPNIVTPPTPNGVAPMPNEDRDSSTSSSSDDSYPIKISRTSKSSGSQDMFKNSKVEVEKNTVGTITQKNTARRVSENQEKENSQMTETGTMSSLLRGSQSLDESRSTREAAKMAEDSDASSSSNSSSSSEVINLMKVATRPATDYRHVDTTCEVKCDNNNQNTGILLAMVSRDEEPHVVSIKADSHFAGSKQLNVLKNTKVEAYKRSKISSDSSSQSEDSDSSSCSNTDRAGSKQTEISRSKWLTSSPNKDPSENEFQSSVEGLLINDCNSKACRTSLADSTPTREKTTTVATKNNTNPRPTSSKSPFGVKRASDYIDDSDSSSSSEGGGLMRASTRARLAKKGQKEVCENDQNNEHLEGNKRIPPSNFTARTPRPFSRDNDSDSNDEFSSTIIDSNRLESISRMTKLRRKESIMRAPETRERTINNQIVLPPKEFEDLSADDFSVTTDEEFEFRDRSDKVIRPKKRCDVLKDVPLSPSKTLKKQTSARRQLVKEASQSKLDKKKPSGKLLLQDEGSYTAQNVSAPNIPAQSVPDVQRKKKKKMMKSSATESKKQGEIEKGKSVATTKKKRVVKSTKQ